MSGNESRTRQVAEKRSSPMASNSNKTTPAKASDEADEENESTDLRGTPFKSLPETPPLEEDSSRSWTKRIYYRSSDAEDKSQMENRSTAELGRMKDMTTQVETKSSSEVVDRSIQAKDDRTWTEDKSTQVRKEDKARTVDRSTQVRTRVVSSLNEAEQQPSKNRAAQLEELFNALAGKRDQARTPSTPEPSLSSSSPASTSQVRIYERLLGALITCALVATGILVEKYLLK